MVKKGKFWDFPAISSPKLPNKTLPIQPRVNQSVSKFAFKGATHTSLDDKGRLNMPTRFRDAFAQSNNELTITRHPHGCLLIFTRPNWESFSAQIEVMPIDSQWVKRMFYGYAMDMELDKSGRVLITPELRSTAQLSAGSEIVLLGMGRYVELWERQLHAAHEAKAMTNEIPQGFKELAF